MRPRTLVGLGALFGVVALAAAGCGLRATAPAADAAVDGHADAGPPHDGAGGDHFLMDVLPHDGTGGDTFQIDGPPALDAAGDTAPPVPDGGAPTASCVSAGGVLCTRYRWEICPIATEPVPGADPHLACGQGGWCCRPAPPSTCSWSGQGNCVPGACTGCWATVPGLTCEAGRVCCQDICD